MSNKVGNNGEAPAVPQYVPAQQQQQQQQQQMPQYYTGPQQMMQPAPYAGLVPNQPTLPMTWMKPPQFISSGLEYIESLDKLMILQEVNQMQALTGVSTNNNRYSVCNTAGEQIYVACENPTVGAGYGNGRAFVIQLLDFNNREVMRIIREHSGCKGCGCCICCCKSCAHEVKIEAPPGQMIGFIRQSPTCCSLKYGIYDANQQFLFDLNAPAIMMTMSQIEFPINSPENGQLAAKITKFQGDVAQEYYTSADNFGLEFPSNTPINLKVLFLGAVFLIDFMFFEFTPLAFRRRHHHHHHYHH